MKHLKKEKIILQTIRAYQKRGYSQERIRKKLKEKMYPQRAVDHLFWHLRLKKAMIIGLPVIVVLLGVILFGGKGYVECQEDTCFFLLANNCEKAKYNTFISGAAVQLTTNDCGVLKEITFVDASEPEEIRLLLEGKQMECQYGYGDFDEQHMESITVGLAKCEGDLKDVILGINDIL